MDTPQSNTLTGTRSTVEQLANEPSIVFQSIFFGAMGFIILAIVGYRLVPAAVIYLFPVSASKLQAAKKHIVVATNSLLVLLLIIPALTLINPSFTSDTLSMFRLAGVIQGAGYYVQTSLGSGEGVTPSGGGTISGTHAQLIEQMVADESRVRQVLASKGIGINKGPCSSFGQSGCTSVGKLSQGTIDLLFQIQKDCNCTFTVTGGTEWWLHGNRKDTDKTAHGPGNTGIDLGRSTQLTNYIYSSYPKADSKWSICTAAFVRNGYYFCDERSDHWHIQKL